MEDANVNEASGKSMAEALAVYQAMYGEPETPSWVHGYDATILLLSGIDSVVSEVGGRLYVGHAALREAIAETENFEGLVGMLTCEEFGDCGTGRVNIYHHTDPSIMDPAQLPVVYSLAPPQPVYAVELPGDHGLGNWLENHFDRNYPDTTSASLIVPAGQYRDMGDMRFSCPSDGADCEVTFVYSYCIPAVCPDTVSLDGAVPAGI